MEASKLINKWKHKLAANIAESERQQQFVGERLGVFARLRELERERRRIARRLIQLDPESETAYAIFLG